MTLQKVICCYGKQAGSGFGILKRYKLKDGLKIEKYLNINRPDDGPNRLI